MKFETGCAGCFAGLSCGVRVEIINLLKEKRQMGVSEIAKHFKVKQPTVTHHLIYLKKMGVLASKKDGRRVIYYIHPKCASECQVFI